MSYFSADVPFNNLLFKDLNIHTTGDLVIACLVTFFVTVLFEGMKMLKLYIDIRIVENPLAEVQNRHSQYPDAGSDPPSTSSTNDANILLSSLRFPATIQQIRNKKIMLHCLSTLSMMMNLIVGYLLMLIVMTFDVWLTVAVVVGSGLGYWIFNVFGQLMQLRLKSSWGLDISTDDHHELPPPQMQPSQACHGNF